MDRERVLKSTAIPVMHQDSALPSRLGTHSKTSVRAIWRVSNGSGLFRCRLCFIAPKAVTRSETQIGFE